MNDIYFELTTEMDWFWHIQKWKIAKCYLNQRTRLSLCSCNKQCKYKVNVYPDRIIKS